MGIKNALKDIRLEYRNAMGRGLEEKYVVIESDDWGSIRQPSRAHYDAQVKRGSRPDRDPFFHYDALERNEDLESLLEVLSRHRDARGRPAVFTPNYVVANPDFDAITNDGFARYHFETADATLRRDLQSGRVPALWVEGMERGVWAPQLHGREHVQVAKWMESLRHGDEETVWAFSHRMISTSKTIAPHNRYAYMDAFNYAGAADENRSAIEPIVHDAVGVFSALFGLAPETFVAPCYVWNDALEEALLLNGVCAMQGGWYQWLPIGDGSLRRKGRLSGEIRRGMLHTVRNCLFEHSLFGEGNAVESCLKQVDSAFRLRRPAIISSHRVNYIGRIEEVNRARGLRLLDQLLWGICRTWPDVAFVSSGELTGLYRAKRLPHRVRETC